MTYFIATLLLLGLGISLYVGIKVLQTGVTGARDEEGPW